jgi:ABC-type glycerol-3-phosphate transport system substrate-binding protein
MELASLAGLLEIIEVKVASGSTDYDVINVDVSVVSAYVKRDYILPLDKYFPADKKAKFVDSAVDAGSVNGVFYSTPLQNSSVVLFYNNKLLKQAGVTVPPNDVTHRLTWEQVVDMAAKTVNAIDPNHNQGISGIMFQQATRTYQMLPLPNSFGEKSIGPDGLTVDGVINTPGWVKAMTWLQDISNSGVMLRGITANDAQNYFNSGKVVFLINGTFLPPQDPNLVELGYAPTPAFAGYEDKIATPTGSWGLGINKYSKKPDDAAQFIEYLSQGEGHEIWVETHNELPATKSGLDKILKNPNADGVFKIAAYEAMNTAVPRPVTVGMTEYNAVMEPTFEDIRNGADIKSALDNAVRQINTAFQKYK